MTEPRDRDDEGPIEPEVVDPGGEGGTGDGDGPTPPRPARTRLGTVRVGCIILALFGALLAAGGVWTVADPAAAVCTNARSLLEDKQNAAAQATTTVPSTTSTTVASTSTTGEAPASSTTTSTPSTTVPPTPTTVDIESLPCEDAVARAEAQKTEDDVLQTEGGARATGAVSLVVGLTQLAGGVLTLRRRTTTFRRIALVGAAVGLALSLLTGALLGLLVFGYVVYALMFSLDAREAFGDPRSPGLFRPRR